MLKDTGIEIVECCQDGKSALRAYEEFRPDLVTLDIIMPGMDGLDTAKELLEKWPDARILMVSSLAYDDTVEEAEKIGTKGFLYKPFTRETLVEKLKKAMED